MKSEYDTTIFDNLSSGHRDALLGGRFMEGDLADTAVLDAVFAAGHFDAVMNFAGSIQVGESVQKPGLYYRKSGAPDRRQHGGARRSGVASAVPRPAGHRPACLAVPSQLCRAAFRGTRRLIQGRQQP